MNLRSEMHRTLGEGTALAAPSPRVTAPHNLVRGRRFPRQMLLQRDLMVPISGIHPGDAA